MEAARGFEPRNNDFADRRLNRLATPPLVSGGGAGTRTPDHADMSRML